MSAPKILIFGPAWVGDMVLAQSLFKVLKARQPDCIIDVAAPAWTMPLIERMPEINQAIPLPFKHGELAFWKRIQFGLNLKKQEYSQSILLTNSFKSAIIPFAAGIARRTSFIGEMRYGLINDIHPLDKTKLVRTVDRFVSLGLKNGLEIGDIPAPVLIADKQKAIQVVEKLNANAQGKILGLCPGAEYGEAKRWPAEYYAEIANEAMIKGWQVWLFGSDKDIAVTSQINQLTQNRCLDIGGKTKLGEAIDLMSLCHTVISNDSGLMHVAAALGKSLIAIYGSSDPLHTPPMSAKATVFYLGLECSPCFERVCPLGHLDCLRLIKPEQVMQRLTKP
jgi:heptosyltransferase-2